MTAAPDWPWDDSDLADAPVMRCRCGHGPSTHTGGYGTCWQTPCACSEYRDPPQPRIPEHLRTDDIQDYLRQKGEIS